MNGPTVDQVRQTALAMLAWCDDETASPTILGSILTPLVPAVRAQVEAEHADDLRHRIEVSQQIEAERRAAEAERDEYHRHWQEALAEIRSVQAQVAGEIADKILAACPESDRYLGRTTYLGMRDGYRHAAELAREVGGSAASPVPAEQPAGPTTPCERCEERPMAGPSGLCDGCEGGGS